MKPALRLLMLEDNPLDAELILATLAGDGIDCEAQRMETRTDFIEALKASEFDLILSDCSLPSFDGLSALRLAREMAPEKPFVFVSGTIGEETAIESLKNGATDYILKHRMSRLCAAVRRAIDETEVRQAKQQAERDRERAESLFRALFDQMAVAVIMTDLEGRIVRTNPATQRLLGYSEKELNAIQVDHLVPPCAVEVLRSQHAELTSGQTTSRQFDIDFHRSDGKAIQGRTVVSLIQQGDAPEFIVHLIEDVTERNEMERRFIEAQKMEVVGRMAAGIAHDFNNVITIIHGYSSVLLEKAPMNDEVRRGLQEIRNAGLRATTLTQRLLSFSRHKTSEREVLDLNTVIFGLDTMLRQLLGDRVRLIIALDPLVGLIEADRGHLEQVVLNLAINARDAMSNGGDLTVSTQNFEVDDTLAQSLDVRPGPYVVLAVTDTGCGMDQALQAKIFEPFFTTKEAGRGTGLGLWMVKEIIKQAGGAINIFSQVGNGTTFHICLPRALDVVSDLSPGSKMQATGCPDPGADTTVVLVADDDPSIRMMVSEILGRDGYEVVEAEDGKQAMELLRSYPVDLLVTDLIMPDQDGLETIRAVIDEFPMLRVLAMSGGFGSSFLHTAKLMGSDEILPKPFDAESLRSAVTRVLANA